MKNRIKIIGLISFLFILTGLFIHAGEGGEAQASVQNVERSSLLDLYIRGGIIGFLITGLSIISMTLAILNFLQLKKEKLIPDYVIADLESMIEEEDIDGAIDLCQGESFPLAKIMGAALQRIDSGREWMTDAMIETSEEQANILSARIGYLSFIGGIAPMIGLFGTVSGMIVAFDIIAVHQGMATPSELARGIMEALITTFLGLMVAIPTLGAYHYLKNQVNSLVIETNNICSDLLDRIHYSYRR